MARADADPHAGRRRAAVVVAVVASAAALAVAAAVLLGGGESRLGDLGDLGDGRDRGDRGGRAGTTLALTAPDSGDGTTTESCAVFDVSSLRATDVAFAGTVTEVRDGGVALDVDRWYKGGSADEVIVRDPGGSSVALDGVGFTEGERFLVSATDGTVNGCGLSGPSSDGLEAAYAAAFGG